MHKTAFITSRLEKASARYRFIQYVDYLKAENIEATLLTLPKGFLERIKFYKNLKNYDSVFLQRRLLRFLDFYLLRKNSKKLLFDFDDAIMFRDSSSRSDSNGQHSRARERMFKRTVSESDEVIAGNSFLKEKALKYKDKVNLLPTTIEMEKYVPQVVEKDFITIGWIGSAKTLFYLEDIKDVFEEIGKREKNVKLKIIADDFFDLENMEVLKVNWTSENEIDELNSIDIGIMPLTVDDWSKGKCGFKLIQFMALKKPCVCSPVGVNRDIVNDGENGFWAKDKNQWKETILKLIRDKHLRQEMGDNAGKKVRKEFSTKENSKNLASIIKGNV